MVKSVLIEGQVVQVDDSTAKTQQQDQAAKPKKPRAPRKKAVAAAPTEEVKLDTEPEKTTMVVEPTVAKSDELVPTNEESEAQGQTSEEVPTQINTVTTENVALAQEKTEQQEEVPAVQVTDTREEIFRRYPIAKNKEFLARREQYLERIRQASFNLSQFRPKGKNTWARFKTQ